MREEAASPACVTKFEPLLRAKQSINSIYRYSIVSFRSRQKITDIQQLLYKNDRTLIHNLENPCHNKADGCQEHKTHVYPAETKHAPFSQQRSLLPQHVLQLRRPRGTFSRLFCSGRLGLLELSAGVHQHFSRAFRLLGPEFLGLAHAVFGPFQAFFCFS